MSEYQYYEFIALDRPLTAQQIDEVREFSSRAEISSTSFVNEYNFGSFKGDPAHFLERYFDVMLYYANWGTHSLMMNVPADAIDPTMLEHYCVGDSGLLPGARGRSSSSTSPPRRTRANMRKTSRVRWPRSLPFAMNCSEAICARSTSVGC